MSRILRTVAGPVLVVAVGAVAWSYFGNGLFRKNQANALPVFFSVPDFNLTERSGKQVGRAVLLGKIWVANFIYTHCPDTCPLQTAEMARLQKDFAGQEDFRLVSITVDPERDTQEVLKEYADRFGADPKRWFFLTGERKAVYDLALKGFRLSVADPEKRREQGPTSRVVPLDNDFRDGEQARLVSGRFRAVLYSFLKPLLSIFEPASAWAHHPGPFKPFIHSSRFALVDWKGDIRGYYHSDERKALQRLRVDIRKLLESKR